MSDHVHNVLDLSGALVVAAVDYHQTTIYVVGGGTEHETVTPDDPRGLARNVYHRHGNPDGTYESQNDEYWHTIGEALRPAEAVLLLGNGKGKANESHHLVAYVEEHMHEVAALIVADVRIDVTDLTDAQVQALGEQYFGETPPRDHGDSRRGAP